MVNDSIIEMAKENFEDMESQQEQQEQDNLSSFNCAICLSYVSSNRRFTNENRCLTHSYCLDCIENHIQPKLEDYNLSEIKCPALDCNAVLDPLVCRSVLSPRVFEKWCDKLCESTLTQCQKAYCPFQTCSTLILNECEASVTKSNCPVCKRVFCFKCERPWHAGYGCDEARGMTDRNDILFGALMEARRWCGDVQYANTVWSSYQGATLSSADVGSGFVIYVEAGEHTMIVCMVDGSRQKHAVWEYAVRRKYSH